MDAVFSIANQQLEHLNEANPTLSAEDQLVLLAINAISDQLDMQTERDAGKQNERSNHNSDHCVDACVLSRSNVWFGAKCYSLWWTFLVFIIALTYSHGLGQWLYANLIKHFNITWLKESGTGDMINQRAEFLSAGLAFALITMIGFMLVRRVERHVKFVNRIPFLGTLNRLGGGIVYLLLIYIELFFLFVLRKIYQLRGTTIKLWIQT
ncbi:Colicin V production protein [Weissella viridescens]|uniref:Colicin V production protein n=1 Tax=Weissella viridescens TaxID=1629 RepID=A0A380P2L5_WEIVI|nr:Colicin V production protein [Weissella viridescens]